MILGNLKMALERVSGLRRDHSFDRMNDLNILSRNSDNHCDCDGDTEEINTN